MRVNSRPILYAFTCKHWKTAPSRELGVWAVHELHSKRRRREPTPLDEVCEGEEGR